MKIIRTVLIVIVLFVVMLEIGLRVLAIFPSDSQLFVNDSDLGFRMRPYVTIGENLRTNSRGFNDIEQTIATKKDHVRVAIIGDSFVFGAVSRDKNFVTVLKRLAGRARAGVEFLNMGVPGGTPKNYLALIKKDAVAMNADIICVVFFIGNDIVESHPDFKTVIWLGSPRVVLERPYLIGLSKEYSYVYRALRSLTRQLKERLSRAERGSFTKANFLAIEYQRSEIYEKDNSPHVKRSYRGVVKILRRMASESGRLKKKFLIVLAPDELQVSLELRLLLAKEYGMNMDFYDFGKPQRMIASHLRESKIAVLDLLPSFRDAAKNKTLYTKQNTHWNEAGNLLAAEIIWPYLSRVVVLGNVVD